jgi:hypothetical protein
MLEGGIRVLTGGYSRSPRQQLYPIVCGPISGLVDVFHMYDRQYILDLQQYPPKTPSSAQNNAQ